MSKRPVFDLGPVGPEPRPVPRDEEPVATIYCRCPQSIADALRDIAHARSRGRRRRVTVNELVIEALRAWIDQQR